MNETTDTPGNSFGLADVLLFGAILATMLWGLGSFGLYEPHEGHFGGVGREMALSGDWITPQLNGAPYLLKPPLFYWMIALSYTIFGFTEWAARLPQVLLAWAATLLAWHWARQVWGIRAGRIAAAMLAVAGGWIIFSRQLMTDTMLSLLYLACVYFLWKSLDEPVPQSGVKRSTPIRYWAGLYAVIGLLILAKGLIGLAFFGFVLLGFCAWRGSLRPMKPSHPLLGLAIVAAIAGPWIVLVEHRNPGFLKYVIYNEHLSRLADKRWPPDYTVSKTSALGFFIMALVWTAPWCLALPQVLAFAWKQSGRRQGSSPQEAEDALREKRRRDAHALLLLAALVPTLFFIPVPSRLIYYGLPTLPPFIVLAAGWWASSRDSACAISRTTAAGCFLLAGIGAVVAGTLLTPVLSEVPQMAIAPDTITYLPALAYCVGAGLFLGGLMLGLRRVGIACACICAGLALGQINVVKAFGAYDAVRSSRRFVAKLDKQLGEDCIWVSEGSKEAGAGAGTSFYLGLDKNGALRPVLIMGDDPRRIQNTFPNVTLNYLIDQRRLAELWSGSRPVIFFTDFLRTDWVEDKPRLPDGAILVPLEGVGSRRAYVNAAALKRLETNQPSIVSQ